MMFFFLMIQRPPRLTRTATLFPYTTLFRSHGVTVVFITLPNTKIELLEPLGEASPISAFLERNPAGGIHHICYEVDDIIAARDRRSEEHTSELQSLMRISYAVFCLKKQIKDNKKQQN